VRPLLPSPAGLFIYSSVRDSPSSPLGTQGALPSLLCVFCCCCLLFRFFSLFFPGWGSVCPGGYAIWPSVVCGSTMCRLAHLVVCVSQASRSWRLAALEPSWFLCLMWSGDAMCRLGVWRSQSLALLGGFSCKVYLQRLSKILF
jgi:hypothetical protein